MKNVLLAAALGVLLFASGKARADSSFTGAAKDAWLTGKIETAFVLNAHLNPFAINTDVDNGIVHLTGTVRDDIDRDLAVEKELAEQIAANVGDVEDVKNNLVVDAE